VTEKSTFRKSDDTTKGCKVFLESQYLLLGQAILRLLFSWPPVNYAERDEADPSGHTSSETRSGVRPSQLPVRTSITTAPIQLHFGAKHWARVSAEGHPEGCGLLSKDIRFQVTPYTAWSLKLRHPALQGSVTVGLERGSFSPCEDK
jgi:hypothetical protein